MTSTMSQPTHASESGRTARLLEPLHAMIYFAPEAESRFVESGLEPGSMCYHAGRAAPLGAVPAAVVAATFFNFNPDDVAAHIPRAWSLAEPRALVEARFEIADAALRRLLGIDVITSPELAEAAANARRAAEAARPEGRVLAAAHLALDWPVPAHLQLWHALSVLREHRGDGHVALLVAAGLAGIEALITHTATGVGFEPEFARTSRGWSREQWDAGVAGLRARGILDPSAELALTREGVALREELENDTNRLAAGPWRALGAEGTVRLAEIGGRLAHRALQSGAFPADGVFARR